VRGPGAVRRRAPFRGGWDESRFASVLGSVANDRHSLDDEDQLDRWLATLDPERREVVRSGFDSDRDLREEVLFMIEGLPAAQATAFLDGFPLVLACTDRPSQAMMYALGELIGARLSSLDERRGGKR